MLEVYNIHKSFGGLKALDGVDLEVEENSIVGLIGPNGSGKTTLFNTISGFYEQDQGKVLFKGESIDGLSPHQRAVKGLYRTFQISRAPAKMTVIENMLLAPKTQVGESISSTLFQPGLVIQQEENNLRKALRLLELVKLKVLGNEYAGNLSGGQKKLLALARILMTDPDLILLDEPTAGVNPTLTCELLEAIKDLQEEEGKTFFLIEHNMKVISGTCNKIYVLDFGQLIAEGTCGEIQQNEKVLQAYLSGSTKEGINKT